MFGWLFFCDKWRLIFIKQPTYFMFIKKSVILRFNLPLSVYYFVYALLIYENTIFSFPLNLNDFLCSDRREKVENEKIYIYIYCIKKKSKKFFTPWVIRKCCLAFRLTTRYKKINISFLYYFNFRFFLAVFLFLIAYH